MHIHPGFYIAGLFCCFALGLWLLLAAIYLFEKRRDISKWDIIMTFLSSFAIVALVVPGSLFA
ncbi:MAG TPA: hypothetical protein VF532_11755 [Candidatus Angelobacter sp.]